MFRFGVIRPAIAVLCLLADAASGQSPVAAPTPAAAPTWSIGEVVVQVDNARRNSLSDSLSPPAPGTTSWVFDPSDDIVLSGLPGFKGKKIAEGLDPVFSPDGRLVAYCGFPSLDRNLQIMVIRADGSRKYPLTNIAGAPCAPAWSPDGTRIAFNATSNKGPVVMVLDLQQAKILTIARGTDPRWSPNGKKLLFIQSPGPDGGPYAVAIANPDGTDAKKIVDIRALVPGASWGADGASIVYTNDMHHRSAIFRVNLDGSNPEEIAGDKNLEMYFPSISPDGKQLVVVTGDENSATLQLIDLETHKARTLAAGTRGEVHWVKSH